MKKKRCEKLEETFLSLYAIYYPLSTVVKAISVKREEPKINPSLNSEFLRRNDRTVEKYVVVPKRANHPVRTVYDISGRVCEPSPRVVVRLWWVRSVEVSASFHWASTTKRWPNKNIYISRVCLYVRSRVSTQVKFPAPKPLRALICITSLCNTVVRYGTVYIIQYLTKVPVQYVLRSLSSHRSSESHYTVCTELYCTCVHGYVAPEISAAKLFRYVPYRTTYRTYVHKKISGGGTAGASLTSLMDCVNISSSSGVIKKKLFLNNFK